MAWVATAIIVTGAIGATTSYFAAEDAAEAAEAATDAQMEIEQQKLDYAKEQQANWDAVFGPTQDILAEYYSNLDPDDVAATNINTMQQNYQKYQTDLNRTLTQRGMGDSGLGAELASQAGYGLEMSKAQERNLAPERVAQQQASFLGIGMGQQAGLQQNVMGSYGSQANMYANQYAQNMQQQQYYSQAMSQGIQTIGQGFGYGFSSMPSVSGTTTPTYDTTPIQVSQALPTV